MQLVFVDLRGNRTATREIDALTFYAMVDDLQGCAARTAWAGSRCSGTQPTPSSPWPMRRAIPS